MFIVESPFKYTFHFSKQGSVKKQPVWVPQPTKMMTFMKLPHPGNKSQWIMGLSVATTCSNSTSWAVYLRIHTAVFFFFFQVQTSQPKSKWETRFLTANSLFRTSSLLLHRAKQLSCMMKVSLANVSGSHLKREFTILSISLFFSWNIPLTDWSTELYTLGQRSNKKKEVVLQVAPRLESNWEESALLTVPKFMLELHYAA